MTAESRRRVFGVAGLVFVLSLTVGALSNVTWAQINSTTPSDAGFLQEAVQSGYVEILGSQMALSKSSNPRVKAFAQQMVEEHTAAVAELQALARTKSVELPSEPTVIQRTQLRVLGAMDNTSFDKRYANQVGVNGHEDAVHLFERVVTETQDPDIRAFSTKSLPMLQNHLAMARQLKVATDSIP